MKAANDALKQIQADARDRALDILSYCSDSDDPLVEVMTLARASDFSADYWAAVVRALQDIRAENHCSL